MNLLPKLLASAALAAGLALPAMAQDDPFQVGFIYVGSPGDYGWTYEHDQARLAVEEHFGDSVETVYLENVPEGADAERSITQMILGGADMVFLAHRHAAGRQDGGMTVGPRHSWDEAAGGPLLDALGITPEQAEQMREQMNS